MYRFQHIGYLYILAILPVLVLLFISMVYWRRRKLKKLGDEGLVNEQMLGYIMGRNTTKFILSATALALIIIGLANLQTGDKAEKVQRKGIDVIIALDVSKSMLAKDIAPDRLTRAKQLIQRLVDKMSNDRIGLIVFAGRAYLHVPLTVDYSAVKMMLQNVSPDMVPAQGTVIGDAINMGLESFQQNERKYKSMIVISDGEDHDDRAIEKAREAAESGIIIHTVGIGSPQGATLYDPDTKANKLDENGNVVVSKLNEDEMKSIASAGHGSYQLLQNTDEVSDRLIAALEGMEQKTLGSFVYTEFTSYFQYFLLAGLLLLVIEWLIPGTSMKSKASSVVAKAAALAGLLLTPAIGFSQTNRLINEGNKAYEHQNYKEAANDYQAALKKDPNNYLGLFNLSNSLYQQKQFDSSRRFLEASEKNIKDKGGKAAANYNIGNSYMAQQKYEEAVNAYKKTLRNNPNDVDAKYNLSYAEEMLKKQNQQDKNQKQQQQNQQQQQQKDKDKDKDKDKQQQQQKSQDGDSKDQKEDQQQQNQQPGNLSQQQADQLLNALQQQEKKLQDKLKKEKGANSKFEKDW